MDKMWFKAWAMRRFSEKLISKAQLQHTIQLHSTCCRLLSWNIFCLNLLFKSLIIKSVLSSGQFWVWRFNIIITWPWCKMDAYWEFKFPPLFDHFGKLSGQEICFLLPWPWSSCETSSLVGPIWCQKRQLHCIDEIPYLTQKCLAKLFCSPAEAWLRLTIARVARPPNLILQVPRCLILQAPTLQPLF